MYSRLDSIFRTSLRQAESADTWMGLRRKDEEPERKKDEKPEKDKDDSAWEDSTTVSVPALKAFLVALIGTQKAGKGAQETVNVSEDLQKPPPTESPESKKRATAVSAYQRTAQSTGDTPQQPAVNPDSVPQNISLSAEEIRTINTLIDDLQRLEKREIETLTIVADQSMLASVRHAVDKALL